MNGRVARFIVGGFCACGTMASFLIGTLRDTPITKEYIAIHAVFLMMSLLLMDPKLGLEVLNDVKHKVKKRRRDA